MPCSDVTEFIHLRLDPEDRLVEYALRKRTCERVIGAESLLLGTFEGKTVDSILAADEQSLFRDGAQADDLEAFVIRKHLHALQSALAAYVGFIAGGSGEVCAISEISCDENGSTVEALIRVDILTERIKSCGELRGGGCGSCAQRNQA